MGISLSYTDTKAWVVQNASVTQPYKKNWQTLPKKERREWSASVTLGNDINATGNTIEEAYKKLTDELFNSVYYSEQIFWLIHKNK